MINLLLFSMNQLLVYDSQIPTQGFKTLNCLATWKIEKQLILHRSSYYKQEFGILGLMNSLVIQSLICSEFPDTWINQNFSKRSNLLWFHLLYLFLNIIANVICFAYTGD